MKKTSRYIITLANEDGRAYYNGYAWEDSPAKAKTFPSYGHAKAHVKEYGLDPFHTVSIMEL